MRNPPWTGVARRWLLPGVLAGASFLAVALAIGAAVTTPWAMPESIAAALGITPPAGYAFDPIAMLVGVLVHLITSIGLAALFTALARLLRLRDWWLLAGGMVFILPESYVSIHLILHGVLTRPVFDYFLHAIPPWAAVTGRVVFGLVLAGTLAIRVDRERKPAGIHVD
jgi:hypothetical protein